MGASVATIHQATLVPVLNRPDGGFSCGVFDGALVAVAGSRHAANDQPAPPPEPAAIAAPVGAERVAAGLYGGLFFNHFGHFLMESIGRLWAVSDPAFADRPIFVHAPWGAPDVLKDGHYARIILDLFEIDPHRIRFVTGPILVDDLAMPDQLYGFHCFGAPEPRFVDFLRVAQKNVLAHVAAAPAGPKKVLVSRSKWQQHAPKRGLTVGAAEFDAYMAANGWTIVTPEEMSFLDQLKTYAGADKLIFVEGSAQHACVLLPDIAGEVHVLLRRPDPWDRHRVTAQFNGVGKTVGVLQFVEHVYFLGQPPWSGLSLVDFTKVVAAMKEAGLVDSDFDAWPEIKPRDLERMLRVYVDAIAGEESFIRYLMDKR